MLLQKLDKAKNTDEIVHIVSKDDLNKKLLSSNIWKFEAKKVPDFAFGTALNYLWDGTSIKIKDKRVFVDVAYNPTFPTHKDAEGLVVVFDDSLNMVNQKLFGGNGYDFFFKEICFFVFIFHLLALFLNLLVLLLILLQKNKFDF